MLEFALHVLPLVHILWVQCPTHIGGNRLDLVMTDAPDIVNVVVGTALDTSDIWSIILKSADPLDAFDRAIG